MRNVLRHLPLLLCCLVVALDITSCGDEPRHPRPGSPDNDTPADTVQPVDTTANDTTGGTPVDTTTADTTGSGTDQLTITITAPRNYGYMGQTMQLKATTSAEPSTPVTWTSSRPDVATVDHDGFVTFANVREDGQTVITASADGASATLTLSCRRWAVALRDGTAWVIPDAATAHRSDTITLTIVNSSLRPIDDNGFNAASCQWSHSSRNADVATLIGQVLPPEASNGWQTRYIVAPAPADGAILTIKATLGDAASSLSVLLRNP